MKAERCFAAEGRLSRSVSILFQRTQDQAALRKKNEERNHLAADPDFIMEHEFPEADVRNEAKMAVSAVDTAGYKEVKGLVTEFTQTLCGGGK